MSFRKSDKLLGASVVDGGTHTARVTASPQDQAARRVREADALRYLTRLGLADGDDSVAAILGLTGRSFSRSQGAVLGTVTSRPFQDCPECGKQFAPSTGAQRTCSRKCGQAHRRTEVPS